MIYKSFTSFLFFSIFIFFAFGSSDDRTPEEKCADGTTAFVMSQSFVEKRLRSPSTADFPYTSSEGVRMQYMGECTHKIWAYVDAQNAFGATIRTNYYTELQNKKGTDEWRLIDLKMPE